MIWLDIKELEYKISRDELTDHHGFEYVMAYVILSSIGVSISTNNANGWIKLLGCVLNVIITVWGLRSIYKVNKGLDGKDFLKRFFAISWVIGMRLLLGVFVFSFLTGLVLVIISRNIAEVNLSENPFKDFISLIFVCLITIISYLLIINSFRRLKVTSPA
ncbi:MAG TPA: hypothetical protein VGK10_07530 [Prolixibacteraceae bacterium]|jgi:hypothetical protein